MLSANASLRPELQGVVKGDHLPAADRKVAWHTMYTDKADGRSNESCYTKRITAHTLNTERSGQPLMHIILCAAKLGAASPKYFWQLLNCASSRRRSLPNADALAAIVSQSLAISRAAERQFPMIPTIALMSCTSNVTLPGSSGLLLRQGRRWLCEANCDCVCAIQLVITC